jgi:tetratricopeptide (TPR) repeat protein
MVIFLFFAWLRMTQQIDDAYALLNRGDLSVYQAKEEEAVHAYQAALTLFSRFGMAPEQERALTGLAHVYVRQGNDAEASRSYQAALTLFQRFSRRPEDQLYVLNDLGDVYTRQGKYAEAVHSYQALLTLYEHLDEPGAQAKILSKIGDLHADQGTQREAMHWFTQARTLSIQHRLDPYGVQRIEERLDHVRVGTDTPGEACCHHSAAARTAQALRARVSLG